MVSRIKTQLYDLITGLGYRVADVRPNSEPLPWLLIRTGGHGRTDTRDLRYDIITINVDIFSAYNGEKEILEVIENISNHIQELKLTNETIIFIEQRTLRIIDDEKTGPCRKHGIVSFYFLCSSGLIDKEETE